MDEEDSTKMPTNFPERISMKTTALGFAAMTLILPISSHAVEVYAGGGVGVNHYFGTDPSRG